MRSFTYLVFLFLCLLASNNALSQVTSGSISGIIRDASGKSLPGATVVANHTPSGTTYGTTTGDNGTFSLQNMRVGGPYEISVSYMGYETQTFNDIYLTLGEPYRLVASLPEAGGKLLQEVNVVAGRNPLLNNQRTGTSTNVGTAQINTLPSVSRSITDFTRLAPQSGPSFSSGVNNANTFAGRDGRYNNVQVNGANINNGFGLNANLMPGGSAQPISLDAIEEIQIGIAPYDVRQTGFTGANINAVTRSGNNQFTGSLYAFHRNEKFNGRKIGSFEMPELANSSNNIFGARLGGPIIKNKLFFFVNGEYEKYTYPGVTWVANRAGATGNVSSVSADSMQLVSNHLKSKYNYDPGAYENYANDFVNSNIKLLARLDWNISRKHKFYISYNHMDGTSDQLTNATSSAGSRLTNSRIGANSLVFANSLFSFKNTVRSFSAELASNFNAKVSNQLLATYTAARDERITDGKAFPFVDIARSKSNINDNQMSFGTELFSYQNDLTNKTLTITNNVTINANRNLITTGIAFEKMDFANSFLPYGTSYYRYASVQDFINDKAPVVFGYSYPYKGQDPYVRLSFGMGGIYLQDVYSVNSKLSLTGGVRVDLPFYFNNLPKNPYIDTLKVYGANDQLTTYDVSQWPKQKPLVSPRIAFNWDVNGDRSVQLRGGTGIFTGRVPFVWFTNQPGNSGTITNQVQITDTATLKQIKFAEDPEQVVAAIPSKFPQEGGASVPGQIAVVSPDFKMPRVWRSNLAVDFKLPFWGMIGTSEALYTHDVVGVYMRNANLPLAQSRLNGGGDNRAYWTNNRKYSSLNGYYVLENSTLLGEAFSWSVGLAKPARKGVYGSLFYTASWGKDLSSNPGSQPNSAWNGLPNVGSPNNLNLAMSQYVTPHRLVGVLSYRVEYLKHLATTISLFYEGASMGRYSYLYGSDINRDGVNADLMYVYKDANEMNWAAINYTEDNVAKTFTVAQQKEAYNKFVAQDQYLNENKGSYAGRYGAKYPFYHRFDARLLQDLFTNLGQKRRTLQLSIDLMNVGNLINPNWGNMQRITIGSGNNATLLNVASVNSTTKVPTYQLNTVLDENGKRALPTTTFQKDLGTNSTWYMQVGFRLIF